MSLKKLFILTFCTLIIIPYSAVMANEEAKYEVINKNQIFEIRKYSDRLAVETSRAGIDSNFRKLSAKGWFDNNSKSFKTVYGQFGKNFCQIKLF